MNLAAREVINYIEKDYHQETIMHERSTTIIDTLKE